MLGLHQALHFTARSAPKLKADVRSERKIESQSVFRYAACRGENMVTVHPEYVVDEQQHRKAVLLPVDEWEQVVNELEELDDIRAYDAAQEQSAEKLPFEQAVREIQRDYDA